MSILPAPVRGVSRVFSQSHEGAVVRTALRNAMTTSPKKTPNAPSATLTTQDRGRVGMPNVSLFRNWAEHSEWVRSALNLRRDQVASAEWVVEKDDDDGLEPTQADIDAITSLLKTPNLIDEDWKTFIQSVVEDLLVLDAGAVEKERTIRGGIAFLHAVDGGTIRVNRFWDGDPEEARYYWYPDYQERARFVNDDFIYMRANPMTYRVVGLAPLETLKLTIDAELNGQSYNTRQIKAPTPDGILNLGEQARPDQVSSFKRYWNSEVAGKGAMAFLGGSKNPSWMPFRSSNRDMQFLEYQMYLARKIAAVFGMSMQDMGVPLDANRATASTTSDNTDDRGLRPLLGLVQTYIDRTVVHDMAFGGPDNNIAFKFKELNLKESMNRTQINRYALSGIPWKTIDEARRDDGRPPVGGELGGSLVAMGPKGPVRFVSEEDIPTAREALESGNKPSSGEGSSPQASSNLLPAEVHGDKLE